MRLLLDENMPARLAAILMLDGHDVLHVGDIGLLGEADEVVLQAAAQGQRILVTADTDFGDLLALSGASIPSVLLLRSTGRRADRRARDIRAALERAREAMNAGALVVVEPSRMRIRQLPIERQR